MRRLAFFPALEGLRGLAVVAVLLFHAGLPGVGGGFLGVSTFFTLSGFLITRLLTSEREKSGRIRLAAFWGRRFRRLMPAALLGLAGIGVLGPFFGDSVQQERLRADGFAALFYLANWWLVVSGSAYTDLMGSPSFIQHFWSLAIEEQYYLVFPLVASGLLAFGRRAPLAGVLALGTLASWLWMQDLAGSASVARLYYGTDTRCGELLLGGVLSLLLSGRDISARGARSLAALGVVGLLVSGVLCVVASVESPWLYRWGLPLYAFASAAVVAGCIVPVGPVRALLSWPPLRWIGRVSYGVYVYHYPIFLVVDAASTGLGPLPLFGLRLALTFGLAAASHRFVEVPILEGRLLGGRPGWLLAPLAFGAVALVFGLSLPGRSIWREGASVRILCVGDSHTWGGNGGVDSYPTQLQQLLDAAEPGVHSVVNMGVPGITTSWLRNRVPDWLARHEPDVLVVWVGVNDSWKAAEEAGFLSRLQRRLSGGVVGDDDPVANLEAIIAAAADADTRVVFVSYPLGLGDFAAANVATCEAARLHDAPLTDSSLALGRLSPSQRGWRWAMHPGLRSYREIARDVAKVLRHPRGFDPNQLPVECLEIPAAHVELMLRAIAQFERRPNGRTPPHVRAILDVLQQEHGTSFDLDTLAPVTPAQLVAADLHPRYRRALVNTLLDLAEYDKQLGPAEESTIGELAEALDVPDWRRSGGAADGS